MVIPRNVLIFFNSIQKEKNSKTYSIMLNSCANCDEVEQSEHIWNHIESDEMKYILYIITVYSILALNIHIFYKLFIFCSFFKWKYL